ncbi:MAG: hypothetical protein CFE28_03385 [Alphaproteobacteria bacterium PA2]|nr:MAG: hypothetical protein CFE28_03385 [Alphaproteobacteria bacterium PA2]
MSGVVRFHVPENRLGKLIRAAGGKAVVNAVKDAAEGIESLRGDFLSELTEILSKAETMAGAVKGADDKEGTDALYGLISNAIGVPSACGMTSLDEMLISLADLIDHFKTHSMWDKQAITIHLSAFRLLLNSESVRDSEGAKSILVGLRQVSERFRRTPPATQAATA